MLMSRYILLFKCKNFTFAHILISFRINSFSADKRDSYIGNFISYFLYSLITSLKLNQIKNFKREQCKT